jgi:hypothetical protein
MTCSFDTLDRATCARLEFTDQKTMIRGEVLAHVMCAAAIPSPVPSPRLFAASNTFALTAPPLRSRHDCLYHVYTTHGAANITSALVTAAIRIAVASTPYGFSPSDANARALRAAGGAMALLLCACCRHQHYQDGETLAF